MDSKKQEEILFAFAVEPTHDRVTLEKYLRAFPELAGDLIDLSLELHLKPPEEKFEHRAESKAKAEEAWKAFMACTPTAYESQPVANPFEQFKGQAFVELASRLQLPRSILFALRDRLVQLDSIPPRLLDRMATGLGATVDSLKRYFEAQPVQALGLQFKANEKPAVQSQVTLQSLIECTEMSDEQRSLLLEDFGTDGLNRG